MFLLQSYTAVCDKAPATPLDKHLTGFFTCSSTG